MNIHPIFVHFPIALLTLYALLEILRFRFIQRVPGMFSIKAFLVIIGSLGAFVALQTGELVEDAFRSGSSTVRQLIETHSAVATSTFVIFGLLALAYIISLFNTYAAQSSFTRFVSQNPFLASVWRILSNAAGFIMRPSVLVILAVLGLLAVTVTGALGGAIVYGPDADPVVRLVYGMFF